jgi:hypothetical protein
MKLYRSAALVSTLVAVLMYSVKAQATPSGLGAVINPDGTVASTGEMQGSASLQDIDYSNIEKATNKRIQEQTQQQIDALRIKNEAEASQLQLNPNAYMTTPTFNDTYDFNAGNVKFDGVVPEAKTQSHVDLAPDLNYPKYTQAIPTDSVWSNTEDVPESAVPAFEGTYAERGNEYATVTMKVNGSNVRVDFNVLVLKAAEQSKQDLRMCLTYSDPYYAGYACNPYTKQPLVLNERGMCAVSLREKTVVNNLSVKTVVDMGVMSNGKCQVWNEF